MKPICLLLSCSLLLVGPLPALAGTVLPDSGCLVLVGGRTADGHAAFASGVIVGVDAGLRVATAAHVARLQDLTVTTQSGEKVAVLGTAFVAGYDLAILQTSSPSHHYVAAHPALSIADNQPALVWGYGAQSTPRMLPALILAAHIRFPDGKQIAKVGFECDQCVPGDSGAGVFSMDGALIGIIAARWRDPGGQLSIMEAEPVGALAQITASK